MCACLVCAQRCALCVHRRSVLFVHRGVRCVCKGELSRLCTEVCIPSIYGKCNLIFPFSRLGMPPLSPHCFHMGLIATARPPA